jgi:hypothetical protein
VVIIRASLLIGTRARLSTWWRDGWKWVAVCDADVVMAVASWAFATEESSGGGGQLVIERVVEKVTSAGLTNYPLLTKTNYNQWSLLMRIKLKARGL